MRMEDNRVNADIRNTPLPRVLEELAARTGIIFEVEIQDTAEVTLSLRGVGLQEAIQRIASGRNCIYYHGTGEGGTERIRFVRVFARPGSVQQPSLKYIGTGVPTKAGDDLIENAEQAVRALAESSDVEVRQEAVEFLATEKTKTSADALNLAARDPAPEVRAAAIEGLASLGAREALRLIVGAFKDENPGVRHSAVTAVAMLGDEGNLRDLRPMLRDQDPSVAAAAEWAIRRLSAPRP